MWATQEGLSRSTRARDEERMSLTMNGRLNGRAERRQNDARARGSTSPCAARLRYRGRLAGLGLGLGLLGGPLAAPAAPELPGTAAPPATIREIQSALSQAVEQFQARNAPGVLAHVSDQYRTGPFTKPVVGEQLRAIFGVYEEVRARVQVDQVRLVGETAWVYSTGEVSGRLPVVGYWVSILTWQRELEVARREGGAWRLFGYQR